MGKGAKIALGCGCLVGLVVVALVALFGAGAFWAKGKLTEVSRGLDRVNAKTEEIERWAREANANPYTQPADRVVPEERLLKFLETRRNVHAVYLQHEARLKELAAKARSGETPASLSDAMAAGGEMASLMGDLRLAQARSLAGAGMSEAEYRDIQLAVYKTAWAAESQDRTGRLPAEAVEHAGAQAQEALGRGLAEARREGVPGAARLSQEDERRLRESVQRMGGAGEALSVPKANVELFRRHETEIRKYAMSGLALLGL